jgi:integrase
LVGVTGFELATLKKGGSWRYRYQDATGKRRVATIGGYPAMKPQQAAEPAMLWRNESVDVLATKEQSRRDAEQAAVMAKHRTLRAYLDVPYQRYQDRKKTGGETLAIIRHNFAEVLDRDMESLTKADILEWQTGREAEGRAHATLRRAFGALKTMLKHATRQDPPILKTNPLENVTLERPTSTERAEQLSAERAASRRLLTAGEIQLLHTGLVEFAELIRAQRRRSRKHGKPHLPDLDAVTYPHWFTPFCYCALYTGLRPGDLYSLTWLELNMNFKRLNKVPEKTRHHPEPARITFDLTGDLYEIMHALPHCGGGCFGGV